MGAGTQGRTRGRRGSAINLIERDWELDALEHGLADARAGAGTTLFVEGAAGSGKSALLRRAVALARETDMTIFEATGKALERDFPFGLAIQLFEPLWLVYGSEDQARLLAGAAQLASPLLNRIALPDRPELPAEPYPVIHGLFRVAYNLITPVRGDGSGGLAIVVDDAHLADSLSLRFLAYVAERSSDLPIALITAVRSGEKCAEPKALAMLRRAAQHPVLRPAPLTADGVAAMIESELPAADPSVAAACTELTAGNPLLVTGLLRALRARKGPPTAATVQRIAESVPESIRDAIAHRLDDLAPEAQRVAQAVSAFPAGASIVQVSRLAELAPEAVSRAADQLARIEILHPSVPLAFVQPLVGAAVRAMLSPLERERTEHRAALILDEERHSGELVAAELMGSDLEAIEALRDAARGALASGSTHRAIQLLERALAEEPRTDLKAELLTELGEAEERAGLDTARERRRTARSITERLRRRAELALEKGHDLYSAGHYREAAAVLEAGLSELGSADERLTQQLVAAYISAAALVDELHRAALEHRREMLSGLTGAPAPRQRVAIAHTAVQDALGGASRAEVRLMVDLAWGNGALMHSESAEAITWPLLLAALAFTDELERQLEICETVLVSARRQRSPLAAATIDSCRAVALLGQGRIADAEAAATAAIKVPVDDGRAFMPIALGVIAGCHLERGRMEQAEMVLATLERQSLRESLRHPILLELRARVRLGQHRPREALEDAIHAGRLIRSVFPKASPGAIPWRSTAAFAHLMLGEPWHARKLAEEELHASRRLGLTGTLIRNLRVLGLAAGGEPGLELLEQAVKTGDSHPGRLEHVKALVDLGAALRRANRRADARGPLRRGLELSHKLGAELLAARAHTELVATGARPRSAMFSGLEALTPSQSRVAGLAAQGLTTRQIAEALFVTPKTVEFHLRHIYQKLDVSSREQLTALLEAA